MRVSSNERGQTLPLVALLLVFGLAVAASLAHLSVRVVERSRATNAADAVALAGAVTGRAGAESVAAANDAAVLMFQREGDVVVVSIERHGQRATARAEPVVELTGD